MSLQFKSKPSLLIKPQLVGGKAASTAVYDLVNEEQGHSLKSNAANTPNGALATGSKGFTLLEISIVIALMAFTYVVAIPNFNARTGSEVANALSRLAGDFRAAFDFCVLKGKPVRLVFSLKENKYWLETTDDNMAYLGDIKTLSDPTPEEEEARRAEVEDEFESYKELGQAEYKDPEKDEDILTESPVLLAKNHILGPKWYKVDTLEWNPRFFANGLLGFYSIQAEHHERAITMESVGEQAMAHIYFLPSGYVEKAVLYLYFKSSETQFDMDQVPFTVYTKPYQGVAVIKSGKFEVDVNNIKEGVVGEAQ